MRCAGVIHAPSQVNVNSNQKWLPGDNQTDHLKSSVHHDLQAKTRIFFFFPLQEKSEAFFIIEVPD